jgi:hypothetical protein
VLNHVNRHEEIPCARVRIRQKHYPEKKSEAL